MNMVGTTIVKLCEILEWELRAIEGYEPKFAFAWFHVGMCPYQAPTIKEVRTL